MIDTGSSLFPMSFEQAWQLNLPIAEIVCMIMEGRMVIEEYLVTSSRDNRSSFGVHDPSDKEVPE